MFQPEFAVHQSILFIQGCQSYPILLNAKCFHWFCGQGKVISLCLITILPLNGPRPIGTKTKITIIIRVKNQRKNRPKSVLNTRTQ